MDRENPETQGSSRLPPEGSFPDQRTSSPDGNDQFSARVPGFEVPYSLRHFAQLVAPVYDRSHLPGFNEILQYQQVRGVGLRQQVPQFLPAHRKQWAEEQRFAELAV